MKTFQCRTCGDPVTSFCDEDCHKDCHTCHAWVMARCQDCVKEEVEYAQLHTPQIGDTVQYFIGGDLVIAKILDVFENNDIRTDQDGVRTADEYTIIEKGATDSDPSPLSRSSN